MDTYCLSKQDLIRLIEVEFEGYSLADDESDLQNLIERWKCWDVKFTFLTTTLLQIVANKQKYDRSERVRDLIERLIEEPERSGYFFEFESLNRRFVEKMLKSNRDSSLNLEDELMRILREISQFNFR